MIDSKALFTSAFTFLAFPQHSGDGKAGVGCLVTAAGRNDGGQKERVLGFREEGEGVPYIAEIIDGWHLVIDGEADENVASNSTIGDVVGETICGRNDDRVRNFDPRIGRMMGDYLSGCTAWLIFEDVFVTAGHCVACSTTLADDGRCELGDARPAPNPYIVEFNVPPSSSNGGVRRSVPEDQYIVRYDSGSIENGKIPVKNTEWFSQFGNDWNVGRLQPNTSTGKKAGKAQGCWFNLDFDEPSPNNDLIRITGHGVVTATPELNKVQTTHNGTLISADLNSFLLRYTADTTGGKHFSITVKRLRACLFEFCTCQSH
mmetsp:Transcript_41096/g.87560  ORF Transcript_41096/g.87560 Transcript_41096/m.87560 type:complete len:317 (+) Transcript_41096:170-1120(+)